MKAHEAKKAVRKILNNHGFYPDKLTAKTVGFSGFGYGEAVFVNVPDWDPNPVAADIKTAAPKGVVVTFSHPNHPCM